MTFGFDGEASAESTFFILGTAMGRKCRQYGLPNHREIFGVIRANARTYGLSMSRNGRSGAIKGRTLEGPRNKNKSDVLYRVFVLVYVK
jgi:hypothetical protein